MQIIQLYINNQRVDLFEDESVTLTQSIKDVKDVSKVFTEFTKRFTVPASSNNNKIFKHYYNADIVISDTSGFDARKKQSATIELNHLPFKKGKIKLDAIELRNNKPYSYKLTFFGNTILLKDILGEDKLSDLDYNLASGDLLFNYKQYNATQINQGLTNDPSTKDFIVPLITHTKQAFYDASDTEKNVQNLYFAIGSSPNLTGLEFSQLKPAIRLHRIVTSIEHTYPEISFSDDFFSSSQGQYYDLFMWMHRKKGIVSSGEANAFYETQFTTFQPTGPDPNGTNGDTISFGAYIQVTQDAVTNAAGPTNTFFKVTKTNATTPYNLRITAEYGGQEETIFSRSDITTTTTQANSSQWNYSDGTTGLKVANYRIYFSVAEDTTAQFSLVEFRYQNNDADVDIFDENGATFSAESNFDFLPEAQIPEMKVIDFLSALFKMFNLVAYADDDDTIVVKTLDDFYDSNYSGTTPNNVEIYDISKYVDTESTTVSPALPYKEIHFKYADTNTVLAKNHQQVNNEEWGSVEYDGTVTDGSTRVDNNIYGDIYKVEIPFHHMKYEKLLDRTTKLPTDFQVGFYVDDNIDPYHDKPLVFYPLYINPDTTLGLIASINPDTGVYIQRLNLGGAINMPSNTRYKELSDPEVAGERESIHFTSYPSEYTGESVFTDTLFEKYYKTYIQDKFEPINRMTKVTAFLPPRIISKIKMNDRLIINDRQYRINKIKSNLKTGKSDIELLND
jgi:hypothetical protein